MQCSGISHGIHDERPQPRTKRGHHACGDQVPQSRRLGQRRTMQLQRGGKLRRQTVGGNRQIQTDANHQSDHPPIIGNRRACSRLGPGSRTCHGGCGTAMRQHQLQQNPAELVIVEEHVVRPFQPETARTLSAGGAVRASDVRGTVLRGVRRIRRWGWHVQRCVCACRTHLRAYTVDGLHRGQAGNHLQPAVDAGIGCQRLRQHRGERHHRRLPRPAHPLPSESAMAGGLAVGHDHGDGRRGGGIRNPGIACTPGIGGHRGVSGRLGIRGRSIDRRPHLGQQPSRHRIRRVHLVEPQHPVGGAAGARQTPHRLVVVPIHDSTLSSPGSTRAAHAQRPGVPTIVPAPMQAAHPMRIIRRSMHPCGRRTVPKRAPRVSGLCEGAPDPDPTIIHARYNCHP